MIWCILWVIIGIILILVRAGVITYSEDNQIAMIFLGSANTSQPNTILVAINAVQIALQFIGLVFGFVTLRRMAVDKATGTRSYGLCSLWYLTCV